jgi:hypothetical protein
VGVESARQREVEDGVDQLRAGLAVLERVTLEPESLPAVKAEVDACVRELLSLPLPQQGPYKARVSELERAIDGAKDALLKADAKVPIGTFRRKIDTASLEREQLVAYARLLAKRPFDGGARQQRYELVVTRALSVEKPGQRLELRPAEEREALLDRILKGHVGDPARREEALKFFADARARLEGFGDAGAIFAADFDREIRAFESGLGDALLDREVLAALVEFEVAFHSRRLSIPASAHPMSLVPGAAAAAGPSRRPPRRPPVESLSGFAAVVPGKKPDDDAPDLAAMLEE